MPEALTIDERIEQELYLPIQGVGYEIIPEVGLLGNDLFETNLYVQDKELSILPSPDVNATASAVEPENPSKDFIKYALKNSDLKENDIISSYKQLHEQIWHKYLIRAKEILVWNQPSPISHPRIISDKSSGLKSFLITDYRITDKDKINIAGFEPDPIVKVDWLKESGAITKEMAKLLGAKKDAYVHTDPDLQYGEGLRTLVWDFRVREGLVLLSTGGPWGWDFDVVSLWGRMIEPK